jgi:hypothetical protein
MGIFDAPQSASFLDRLIANANAAVANNPGGLASDRASWNFPAIDPSTGNTIAPTVPAPVQPAPQPTAPVVAQAASQAVTDPQAAASNILTRMGAALHSVAQGGSLYGAVTGQPDDPQSRQRAQLQQNYQAMVNAGLSPQEATLAVINPEAGKLILAKKFPADQKDKFSVVKTGQDGLGRETYSTLNQSTGDLTSIKSPGGSDVTNDSGLRGDVTKTGQDYLNTLPKGEANIVGGMIDGTVPMPSAYALSKPLWVQRIADAKQADPTFDGTIWSGRIAGRRDFFGGGKSAEMVRSANQTIGHVGDLVQKADALGNSSFTPWNYVKNEASSLTGSDAPGNWVTNAHAVADEIGKLFKGNNLSDSEIHAWADNLSPNMSPTQQRGAIGNLMGLLQHSLDALESKREASIGQMAAQKAGSLLTPESQAILGRVKQWANGQAGGSTASGTTSSGLKWSVQ